MAAAVLPAQAQQVGGQSAADRQNQLDTQQNLDRVREEQQRALGQQQAPPKGIDLKTIQPGVKVPGMKVACQNIHQLRIRGAKLLAADVRAQLRRRYTGRCLDVKDLEGLLGALTRYYIDKGYVTTRAYLPAQDLGTGVLEVTVVEGRIEGYKVRNHGRAGAKVNTGTAFPAGSGALLNLRDLEQGIDQINSDGVNAATLDLAPGGQPGQSVVVVNNNALLPLRLYTTWDNLGVPSTGRDAASATLSEGGLLGLNEVVSLTQRQSAPVDPGHNAAVSALLLSVPFGYNTASYNASHSSYRNVLVLPSSEKLTSKGHTVTQTLSLDRVFYRDQLMRWSVSGALSRQDSRNFLGGEFLTVSSRVLSTLDLGISGFAKLGGGVMNGHLGYVWGLKSFGALHDLPDLPDTYPRAQFGKYTLDLGYSRQFDEYGQHFAWSTQFSGQYSRDTLYGAQQILIGGPTSVRGTLLDSLAGDCGYYVRNEISQLWSSSLGGQTISGRGYLGYDFGRVHNHQPGVPSGSLTGVTLGVSARWRFLNADLFAADALHRPEAFPTEHVQFGVRLSSSF